jgi:hypothetical protein
MTPTGYPKIDASVGEDFVYRLLAFRVRVKVKV